MSNLHPTFAAILKPHLQGQKVSNRSRYRALESVHAELEAAGAVIDIGQLDWAAKEINSRLYEESLDRQYEAAMKRSEACADQMHEALRDLRQAESDREWEQAVIEARERFANEGDK